MNINQYVGELAPDVSLDDFFKSVKQEVKQAKFATDNIRMKNKDGTLVVQCVGDVANLIRKRKEIVRFRCDKIAINEKDKDKEEIK